MHLWRFPFYANGMVISLALFAGLAAAQPASAPSNPDLICNVLSLNRERFLAFRESVICDDIAMTRRGGPPNSGNALIEDLWLEGIRSTLMAADGPQQSDKFFHAELERLGVPTLSEQLQPGGSTTGPGWDFGREQLERFTGILRAIESGRQVKAEELEWARSRSEDFVRLRIRMQKIPLLLRKIQTGEIRTVSDRYGAEASLAAVYFSEGERLAAQLRALLDRAVIE